MGDPAVMLERLDRSAQSPEGIDVGQLGRNRHREGRIGRTPIETGSSETGAG
jgi:hypothetical protein